MWHLKINLEKNDTWQKHSCTNEKKNDQFPSLPGGNIATLWDSFSGLCANLTQVCQKEICARMWILTKKLITNFSMENDIFDLHTIKHVEIVPERNRTDSFSSFGALLIQEKQQE